MMKSEPFFAEVLIDRCAPSGFTPDDTLNLTRGPAGVTSTAAANSQLAPDRLPHGCQLKRGNKKNSRRNVCAS
jgi:hypothetical protein